MDLAKLVSKSCRMLPCHYLIRFGKLDDVNSTSQDSINHEPLLDNASDVNYTNNTEDYTTQDDILPYEFRV